MGCSELGKAKRGIWIFDLDLVLNLLVDNYVTCHCFPTAASPGLDSKFFRI